MLKNPHWSLKVQSLWSSINISWFDFEKCFLGISESEVHVLLSQADWCEPLVAEKDDLHLFQVVDRWVFSAWQEHAATSTTCHSPVCIAWKREKNGGTFPEGPKRWNRDHEKQSRNVMSTRPRWWFQTCLFSPLPGEVIQFEEHIIRMGWNHKLETQDDWFLNDKMTCPIAVILSRPDHMTCGMHLMDPFMVDLSIPLLFS